MRQDGVVINSDVFAYPASHYSPPPDWIARGGVTATHDRLDATVQVSHVSRTFADALNTVTPSATGATGLVPAYTLVDIHGSVGL